MSDLLQAEKSFLARLFAHTEPALRKRGLLVAFSGGADSALLLALAVRLSERDGTPVYALHVNHGIRGEEADRDEAFARMTAEAYGVSFSCVRVDIPAMAKASGRGIEETAREARYECLLRAAEELGVSYVLTAHHATDHAETVLMNLVRGAGGDGLCGIPASRPLGGVTLVRPLLSLTREQILAACACAEISFVSDSTNEDTAYRRNYLRGEILPRLRTLNPSLDETLTRMSQSLSEDMVYLAEIAEREYKRVRCGKGVSRSALLALPGPIRLRVLKLFHRSAFPDAPSLERVHTDAILTRMAEDGDFSLSLPGGLLLSVRRDRVEMHDGEQECPRLDKIPLVRGENILPDGSRILLLPKDSYDKDEIVYKKSIHRDLASATINGGLYVRAKENGDTYRYGGVTHKLKKLFSDAKLSPRERETLPVVCDDSGILWVPHFGVREDGGAKESRDLTFVYILSDHLEE